MHFARILYASAFAALASLSCADLSIGCNNCLGQDHASIVAKCKTIVTHPKIGFNPDALERNVALRSCNTIVNSWNCCEPKDGTHFCSSNPSQCVNFQFTLASPQPKSVRRRREWTPRPPAHHSVAIEERDAAGKCCNIAKLIIGGGVASLVSAGIEQSTDSVDATIYVLVAGWAMAKACNTWHPNTCAITTLQPGGPIPPPPPPPPPAR